MFKDISELIILEQFLRMVNPELEVWIRERDPKSAEEAAQLAEVFMSARRGSRHITFKRDSRQQTSSKFASDEGSQSKSSTVECRAPAQHSSVSTSAAKFSKKDVRCFYCGELGHTKPSCPARKNKQVFCSVPRPAESVSGVQDAHHFTSVLVNGQKHSALIDTGSMQTIVSAGLVARQNWNEQEIPMCTWG